MEDILRCNIFINLINTSTLSVDLYRYKMLMILLCALIINTYAADDPCATGTSYRCANSSDCIPLTSKCNGVIDCIHGDDESNCTVATHNCSESQFRCTDWLGSCVTLDLRCNHFNDCADGSDEKDCGANCSTSQFMCHTDRLCIDSEDRCDGRIDCKDKSDEDNCPPPVNRCGVDQFTCLDFKCINLLWKCDGDADCADGSDELPSLCTNNTCSGDRRRCPNGTCIAASLFCNGINDCGDGYDEYDCERRPCDRNTEFSCTKAGLKCIPVEKVCDGTVDCKRSSSDEDATLCASINKTVNGCTINNGNCSHICRFNRLHAYCDCPTGFTMSADGVHCQDVDECAFPSKCSQLCENVNGSYRCSCYPGYYRSPSDGSCRAKEGEPQLIVSNRHDLRSVYLRSGRFDLILTHLHSAIALDFDYERNTLYFTDVAREKIFSHSIHAKDDPVSLVHEDISTPDGLAFDWVHRNLYWTDTGNNHIDVMSLSDPSNHWRRVLFNSNLDEPRAIVVDPRRGQWFLYWTDWGRRPKIERARLDGSGRQDLITHSMQWPNGLTIDYEGNRLYWVDARLHFIGTAELDGSNPRKILESVDHLRHPFAITVFEDDLYWSDWETQSVLKYNPFSPNSSIERVLFEVFNPMDVHIFHRLKQPHAENVCINSGCSHLCLPSGGSLTNYSCSCPNYPTHLIFELAADNKTCLNQTNIISVPPVGVFTPPPSSRINATDHSSNSSALAISSSNGGAIGTLIGVVIGLIIVVAIIAFLMHRSRRRYTIKVLNFDNPVYRRTTEDHLSIERNPTIVPKRLSTLLEPLTAQTSDI